MKTAREMFEDLGYSYFENDYIISYQNYSEERKFVEFTKKYQSNTWKKDTKITMGDDSEEGTELSLEEIKAIQKQIEELGWNE